MPIKKINEDTFLLRGNQNTFEIQLQFEVIDKKNIEKMPIQDGISDDDLLEILVSRLVSKNINESKILSILENNNAKKGDSKLQIKKETEKTNVLSLSENIEKTE